jgi:peptidoglycan/LPS O-acetylase OafA/YrhL
VRAQHIRALTGVRFWAALYVILYHHLLRYPNVLQDNYPGVMKVARPILVNGLTGVDLFFLLSGFVLAHNYVAVLGDRWDTREALRFLWLRLARIWPLYVFALLLAGALIWVRATRWQSAPSEVLTWGRFLDQLFMVQVWHQSQTDGSSWAGPMWTISTEWLAYLLLPVLALVVLRMRRRLPGWALFVAAFVAMLPLLAEVVASHRLSTSPYEWLPRILCEFTAGMLLSCATAKLHPGPRARARADLAAIGCVVAVLALCFAAAYATAGWHGRFVIVLYLPIVALLAIADGPLSRLLSTPLLVLGGGISYAMYLIHSQFLYLYRDAARFSRLQLDAVDRQRGELLWIVVIVVAALVLHKVVEEPMRKWMTGLVRKPGSGSASVSAPATAATVED